MVKPDSLLKLKGHPAAAIAFKDTTVKSAFSSFWEKSKSHIRHHFEEDLGTYFEYAPGLFLFDRGNSGQHLGIGRHGSLPVQTHLFLDGRPLYDPIYGGMDLNFIPAQFIRTATIEQGISSPLSSVHGEMVSLTSDVFTENNPYSRVGYHKAGLGFSDVDITFGQRATRTANFLLGGIFRSYDGESAAYNSDLQNFRGKVFYFPSATWAIEYSWLHNKLARRAPGPLMANDTLATPNAVEKIGRLDQTLTVKGHVLDSTVPNFVSTFYYSDQNQTRTDSDANMDAQNDGNYAGMTTQISDSLFGQAWTAGANFCHEWVTSDDVGKRRADQGSIYLMDDLLQRETRGLRLLGTYTFRSGQGSSVAGGASGFLKFGKLKWIGAINSSINYPTLFQLYGQTNFTGNSNLSQEIHRAISTGVRWQPTPELEILAEAYLKTIHNPIAFESIDSVKAICTNSGDRKFIGADIQANWMFSKKLQMSCYLSGVRGSAPGNYPQFSAISYLQYSDSFFENDLQPTLRLEARYYSERTSAMSHPYYFVSSNQTLASVFLLNANALVDFGNLKMYFTLENLIDTDYQMVYGYPMSGRTLHYGLRWEFWD